MSQDELPTYASAANTSQVIEAASTGYPAIDAARDAAQKLAARAQVRRTPPSQCPIIQLV